MIGANNPINTTLYDKLGFDLLRDFAPVAGIYRVFQVMVVNPTFPAPTPSRVHRLRQGQTRARSTSARPAPARWRTSPPPTGEWFEIAVYVVYLVQSRIAPA